MFCPCKKTKEAYNSKNLYGHLNDIVMVIYELKRKL